MSIIDNFKILPKPIKKSLFSGLFFALIVALPLFVWTAINVNFNIQEKAQGEPNYCGGTCGSNYNCQANYFCFEGFCRNPICSDSKDCICRQATATATAVTTASAKATIRPTTVVTATSTATASPEIKPSISPKSLSTDIPKVVIDDEIDTNSPDLLENMFWAKYAIYLFVGFALIVIVTIMVALKKSKPKDIPHIVPPTNI